MVELIFFSRLPVFFLGIYFAKKSMGNEEITKRQAICYGVLFLLGNGLLWYVFFVRHDMLWTYGLWWYPFILIVPGLCLAFSWIAQKLVNTKAGFIINGIEKIGSNTLPIYLVYIVCYEIYIWMERQNLFIHSNLTCGLALLVVAFLVCVVIRLDFVFKDMLERRFEKAKLKQ